MWQWLQVRESTRIRVGVSEAEGDAANLSLVWHRWALGRACPAMCPHLRFTWKILQRLVHTPGLGFSRGGVCKAKHNTYFPLAPVTCQTFYKHHPLDFSQVLLRGIQAHKNSMAETQWTRDRNTLRWKEEVWHYQCSSSRAQRSSFFLWDAEHRRACRQRVRTRSHSNSPCFSDCFDIDRINK